MGNANYQQLDKDAYTGTWTLRLGRLPDEKSYVVRDIRAFLQTIQRSSLPDCAYFEPLRLI